MGKTIDITRRGRDKNFSIIRECPHGEAYHEFAIRCLYNCSSQLKAFDEWVVYATKLDLFNAVEYSMQEGFYPRHIIINIIRSILENE